MEEYEDNNYDEDDEDQYNRDGPLPAVVRPEGVDQSFNFEFSSATAAALGLPSNLNDLHQMPKNTASDVYFGRSNTIRQAIESAKSSRSTSFSYFESDLMILPDDLGNDLVNLVELNLSFNNLTHLPDSLAQLTNLKTLRITKNHFIDIPPCISNLTTLTHLNISGNRISALPLEIGNLVNLNQLNADNNKLITLPNSIGQLINLQHLHLHKNCFTSLPSTIGRLTSLISLFLHENQLSSLPAEISQLSSLRNLFVHNNMLVSLPPSIGQLNKMWWLNVSNNQLNQLPSSLGRLASVLTDFMYNGNPLSDLPSFITKDSFSLLNYLQKELPPDVVVGPSTLSADLQTIKNSDVFSDVIFKVNNTSFFGHKAIFYARKHLLPCVFSSFEWLESNQKEEVSLNMSEALFRDILDFVYINKKSEAVNSYFKENGHTVENEDIGTSFEKLLGNTLYSDISFLVDQQLIPAHKALLCCRCSPMSAMFTHNFQESTKKVIEVESDIPYHIFKAVLQYIYTDTADVSGENAVDILITANEYQLGRLKEMCEKAIESGVDDENRVELLKLSNMNHALQLEDFCLHSLTKLPNEEYASFLASEVYKELNDDIKKLMATKREGRTNPFVMAKSHQSPQLEVDSPVDRKSATNERNWEYGPGSFYHQKKPFQFAGAPVFDFGPKAETTVPNTPTIVTLSSLMETTSLSPSSPSRKRSPRRPNGSPVQRVSSPSTPTTGFQFSLSVEEIDKNV